MLLEDIENGAKAEFEMFALKCDDDPNYCNPKGENLLSAYLQLSKKRANPTTVKMIIATGVSVHQVDH